MKSKFIEFKASESSDVRFFYFKLINEERREYSVIIKTIDGTFINASCSCIFGSFFKFSKKNLNEKKECVHVTEAKSLLKLMDYIKDDKNTRDVKEQNDTVAPIEQQNGQS